MKNRYALSICIALSLFIMLLMSLKLAFPGWIIMTISALLVMAAIYPSLSVHINRHGVFLVESVNNSLAELELITMIVDDGSIVESCASEILDIKLRAHWLNEFISNNDGVFSLYKAKALYESLEESIAKMICMLVVKKSFAACDSSGLCVVELSINIDKRTN